MTTFGRAAAVSIWGAVFTATVAPAAHGQDLRGRIVDASTGRGVAQAAVSRLGDEGRPVAAVMADSLGMFSMPLPEGARSTILVERLGYFAETVEYTGAHEDVRIALRPSPIPVEPMVVEADRYERWIRLLTGFSPASLGGEVVGGEELREVALPGRDLATILSWAQLPGATVIRSGVAGGSWGQGGQWGWGTCVIARGTHCIPVFINDSRYWSGPVPTERIEAIVYLRSSAPTTLFASRGRRGAGAEIRVYLEGFLGSQ